MRYFIIIGVIIVVVWQVSGVLGPSRQDRPSETLTRLLAPPNRSVNSPVENGYFMLLGLAVAPGANPVQTGYDIWLESNAAQGDHEFDFDKPGRFELRIPVASDDLFPEWSSPSPLAALQNRQALVRTSTTAYQTLLARYHQWLRMRFDDWGFAHRGVPRIEDLVGAHRLYVIDGFGRQHKIGIERLMSDLARWRSVLRDARTIAMKVTAQVLVEDDVQLLSRILNEDSGDRAVITRALEYLQPLTPGEYSLRWPMQSEFAMAYTRSHANVALRSSAEQDLPGLKALSRAARLFPEDFQHVAFGHGRPLLESPATKGNWDIQASQYDAVIRASESTPLPRIGRTRNQHSNHVVLERSAVPADLDPAWEPFAQRLVETDARLRLVSLQILMRKPTATITVPTRLAEVGSRYFDPFTGFPMLWSPTQQKLYSVGKDGLDDGGDPMFDISVPLAGTHYLPNRQPSLLRPSSSL